ncbi:MAG TPA: anaerobic glycerol-3-phosphate dehydrogenase subunit C [Candidatus Acidoferrum sp.]|nr:anaerobic glycerol-3-phosphate dehydrogenase subunit C [Candidatus Acidoferrum sp.]
MISDDLDLVTDTVEEEAPVEACTKCTACNTVCPVARTTEIFRGPKYLGPESERYRDPHEAAVTAGLDLCSGCKLCEVTCPSQVTIQEYIRRAQNKGAEEKGRTLRDWVLGHTRLLGAFGSWTAPLANFGNRNPLVRWVMEKLVGIHRKRPLPRYQFVTFERWFRRHAPPRRPSPSKGEGVSKRTVAYFYGCWVNYNDRRLGEMAVHVLERNGIKVIVPKQQCCGIPAVVNANMDLARRYGLENVKRLSGLPENVDVIASSTSCGLMLKHDYDHLLEIPGSQPIGARTYDICEYLWMLHDAGELNLDFQPVETRLLYHAPCHLKSHGMGFPATRLLRLVPGVHLEEVDEGCCGISGTFGVKVEKYDLSMKIGSRLFAAVKAAGSDSVLADCETCRMQVEHGTGAHSAHPIEILARAYGYG